MKHPFRHFLVNTAIGLTVFVAAATFFYIYTPKAMIGAATPVTVNVQKKQQNIIYYSPNCPACKQVYQRYFWRSVTGQLKFASIANKQNKAALDALGIHQVPTLVHYKKGIPVIQYSGSDTQHLDHILAGGKAGDH